MKLPKNFIADTQVSDNLSILNITHNRLTAKAVIGYTKEGKHKAKRTCYLFECSCGNSCILRGKDVIANKTKSCGCLHTETSKKQGKKNAKEKTDNPAFIRYYKQYQSSAKRREYSFNLSELEFRTLTSSPCHYCGIAPHRKYGESWKGYSLPYVCNGLDRVDNTRGYESTNVVPCCTTCNHAKHIMSYQEFQDWLSRLVEFRTGADSFECMKTL